MKFVRRLCTVLAVVTMMTVVAGGPVPAGSTSARACTVTRSNLNPVRAQVNGQYQVTAKFTTTVSAGCVAGVPMGLLQLYKNNNVVKYSVSFVVTPGQSKSIVLVYYCNGITTTNTFVSSGEYFGAKTVHHKCG
jgi:hypothetical protein